MAWTDWQRPCGWRIDPTCCPQWEDTDPAIRERAEQLAVYLLWAKSGRQFGRCAHTIRPCRRRCASGDDRGAWTATGWQPVLWAGRWFNTRCGCGGHPCSCTTVCELELPGVLPEPVRVTVDGVDLPADSYRVDNGRWLVRTDGECWPYCQDLAAPPDSPGTWEVEFLTGRPVPPEAEWLAGTLACELLKACDPTVPDTECRLPNNVRRITRQNVMIEFDQRRLAVAANMSLGIPEIDLWLSAVNPHGRHRRLRVLSPDMPRHRETSWP